MVSELTQSRMLYMLPKKPPPQKKHTHASAPTRMAVCIYRRRPRRPPLRRVLSVGMGVTSSAGRVVQ